MDENNITNQPSETKDINSDATELTSVLSDVNTPPTKVAIEETLTNEGAKTGGLGNQNSQDSLEVTSANEIGEDGQDTVTTEEPIDEGLLCSPLQLNDTKINFFLLVGRESMLEFGTFWLLTFGKELFKCPICLG